MVNVFVISYSKKIGKPNPLDGDDECICISVAYPKKVGHMKTVRIRKLLREYLQDRPRSTSEILEYINTRTKHGTTAHVLGNILAKDANFRKVGTTSRITGIDLVQHSYSITIWGLSSTEGMGHGK
jgi:hypothetical protein